jgi:hypothetical protein
VKKRCLAILTTIGLTLFSGCGGGGGSSTSSSVPTLTATFIDSPVSGLEFNTPTLSGTTDVNGNFIYKDGESVTFHIGNIYLGSAKPKDGKVTPLSIINTTDINDARVVRILQTLQSLDSDSNPSNGIVISQSTIEMLKTKKRINLDDASQTDDNVLKTIGLSEYKVSKEQAKSNFDKDAPSNKDTPYIPPTTSNGKYTLIAWNDLGMHCVDGKDYSVFSILPPYNNLHAHLISKDATQNKNITSGVSITYEAVADSLGSINTTSVAKTNFWDLVLSLFGTKPANNYGLNISNPSVSNPTPSLTPAPLSYSSAHGWWEAEGIPVTPYDDKGAKNYYPMVKVVAKDGSGNILASTSVVLPVSDEMTCKACHASTSGYADAKPSAGWVNDADLEKDWKKNILKLHDEKYPNAIATAGLASTYKNGTLLATVNAGQPILCAACHKSNVLGTTAKSGIKSLTAALHSRHANAKDPASGVSLDNINNRGSCYLCHPGSATNCLRGVMGNAKTATGANVIDCQSCHGNMTNVGQSQREGWLDEPGCQHCHDKSSTNGNFTRYTTVFSGGTTLRTTIDSKFASTPNTPAANTSLYRFSKGHGALQCESCHGSTHAEYPSSHTNDNVQSIALQGHTGTIAECSTCHATVPTTANGGPHGMHTVGQAFISSHGSSAKNNLSACASCHGTDYRGNVTSKTWAARTFTIEGKTKTFAAGQTVGCYDCHNGPRGD